MYGNVNKRVLFQVRARAKAPEHNATNTTLGVDAAVESMQYANTHFCPMVTRNSRATLGFVAALVLVVYAVYVLLAVTAALLLWDGWRSRHADEPAEVEQTGEYNFVRLIRDLSGRICRHTLLATVYLSVSFRGLVHMYSQLFL